MPWVFNLALDKAGSNRAAKMAMMAITTSNSIKVNPEGMARLLAAGFLKAF